jgi:serine phosphatase RsbU (regulator of sigma subunit)/pSer/pThr/pTyr-binding forkhead associated (FHA) protein
MARLHILKGPNEGSVTPLDGDRFILGRNPDCDIVIPVTSVSREHAQILRIGGRYYIEDKQSRNGTYVNQQQITARTPLKNNDKIRICDFIAAFLDVPPPANGEEEGPSTVEATLSHTSYFAPETQPAEKLRTLLEISANLAKTLQLDALLPKIAESLFSLFRQANWCFLIVAGEGTDKLQPLIVKARRAADESTARFSESSIRRCLETAQASLSVASIGSVMCAPLCRADGQAFGVIQLDSQDWSKKFTEEDLELLCGVGNQAAIALENARLLEEAVAQERLRHELKLANEVQLSFLPSSVPNLAGYGFGVRYEPAQKVGGDFYDFIPLPEDRLAVVVGDAAGTGIPAALMAASVVTVARCCLRAEPDPAVAVSRINEQLYLQATQADRFATLVVVVLDPATHEATLVSAGHPSPLLHRPGTPLRDALPRDVAGVPLGLMDGFSYDSYCIRLEPGDSLLLFTDGVPESLNVKGEQFRTIGIESALKNAGKGPLSGSEGTLPLLPFGMEGFEGALRGAGQASPRELVDRIAGAVRWHMTGRDPHDDLTLVCLGRAP